MAEETKSVGKEVSSVTPPRGTQKGVAEVVLPPGAAGLFALVQAALKSFGLQLTGNAAALVLLVLWVYSSGVVYLPSRASAERMEGKADQALKELALLREQLSTLEASVKAAGDRSEARFSALALADRESVKWWEMDSFSRNLEKDNKVLPLVVRDYAWRRQGP